MNSPIKFELYEDLMADVVACAYDTGSSAILVKGEIMISLLSYIIESGTVVYLQYDSYEDGQCDYLAEFIYDEVADTCEISIEIATNEKGHYLAGEATTIYKHKDVSNKCISDIRNNPCAPDNVEFIEFAFADEMTSCNDCPEKFDCPDYISNDVKTETNGNTTTVVRNSDGGIRGFSYNKTYTDESDKTSSFSWNFFSDDLNAIKTIAAELGIKL